MTKKVNRYLIIGYVLPGLQLEALDLLHFVVLADVGHYEQLHWHHVLKLDFPLPKTKKYNNLNNSLDTIYAKINFAPNN